MTPEQSRSLFTNASLAADALSEVLPVGPTGKFAGVLKHTTAGTPVGVWKLMVGMTPTDLHYRSDGDDEFQSVTTGSNTVVSFAFDVFGFPYVRIWYDYTSGTTNATLNGTASVA